MDLDGVFKLVAEGGVIVWDSNKIKEASIKVSK